MTEPDLNFPHGPREYIIERCPYCGRRLAEWYAGDETVTILHGQAAMRMGIEDDTPLSGDIPLHPVPGSSYCLRPLCRLRRRLHPPLTPEVP